MCGNGLRCFVRWAVEVLGQDGGKPLVISTDAGDQHCRIVPQADGDFWGLVRLDAYDEGMIMDDVEATVMAMMSPEEYALEALALRLEALLQGMPLYEMPHPGLAALPLERAGAVAGRCT